VILVGDVMSSDVDPNDPVRKAGNRRTVVILLLVAVGFYVASFLFLADR